MRVVAIMLLAILTSSSAWAAGGIIRNGEVLTLGSSGVTISLKPLRRSALPELQMGHKLVRKLILPTDIKGSILKELRPSRSRKFFKVDKISLDEERALVDAYRELIPELPASDRLTLFGMTDASKGETYLLPAFFELTKPEQRAAVLFHESVYASGLVTSYDRLVALERVVEEVLTCSDECFEAHAEIQNTLTESLALNRRIQILLMQLQDAAVKDGQNEALPGVIKSNGNIKLGAFFGDELMDKINADFDSTKDTTMSHVNVDYREGRLLDLLDQYPDSRFLNILLNTELTMTIVRAHYHTKTVSDPRYDGPALKKDPYATAITSWSTKQLEMRFSDKTITYEKEVTSYFRERSHNFLGTLQSWNVLNAVQPIDLPIQTRYRKAYVEKERFENTFSYYDEPSHGWVYQYYLFGLTFTAAQ